MQLNSHRMASTLFGWTKKQKILFWLFLAMLITPNVLMLYTESTPLLTRVVGVLLPLAFYWLSLTFAAKPGKAFWWLFLFIFLDAFELVLLGLYGESPIAVDMFLNVVTTNTTEAGELLFNVLPAFISTITIYGLGIVLSVVSLRNKACLNKGFRLLQRKLSLFLMTAALILLAVDFITDREFNFRDDIFPVNSCYNFGVAIQRTRLSMNYAKASAGFSYQASDTRPDSISQIYVLVVGETARADNFGILGYSRNTTPQLSKLGKSVVAFRDALTMSNTTHKSVPMLLSSVASQGNFNDIYSQKGIISAFRQAGYSTTFISNQRRNGSFIDFLGSEAEQVTFLKDHLPLKAELADDSILTPLKACLDSYRGGRLFIVLHTYGSHFNYLDRYPKHYRPQFTPDRFAEASRENRTLLVNAYDNTIANTDAFLARVIALVQAKHVPAGLVYVSDHGEDIFDDSRNRFLHASPIPTYYQIHVPFIVWTSGEYRSLYPGKWQQIASHSRLPISTSLVTFHTLLDMSGVNSKYLDRTDALSSPLFKVKPRLYVTDHNEMVPIEKAGLKQLDINQFRKHGLSYP